MSLAVERFDARSWAGGELDPLFEGAFPAYITADQAAKAYISRVREWFASLNVILVEDSDVPVATGWAVPIRWNGQLAGLPTGYTDTLRRAVEGREAGAYGRKPPVSAVSIAAGQSIRGGRGSVPRPPRMDDQELRAYGVTQMA